jgi:hypothetical protein
MESFDNEFFVMQDKNFLLLPSQFGTVFFGLFLFSLVFFLASIFIKKWRFIKLRFMAIFLTLLFIATVLSNTFEPVKEFKVNLWFKNDCFGKFILPFPFELDKNVSEMVPPLKIEAITSSKSELVRVEKVSGAPSDISLSRWCNLRAEAIQKSTKAICKVRPFHSKQFEGLCIDQYFEINGAEHLVSSELHFEKDGCIYTVILNSFEDRLNKQDLDFIFNQIQLK